MAESAKNNFLAAKIKPKSATLYNRLPHAVQPKKVSEKWVEDRLQKS